MLEITSRDNQKLKRARKIRDGKIPDFIFIEGTRLVSEALKSNLELSDTFVSESFFTGKKHPKLLESIQQEAKEIFLLPDSLFKSLSDTESSQGIILIAKSPEIDQSDFLLKINNSKERDLTILLLHKVNNPSNLGAILRTAEAAGVSGVISTKGSANAMSPKALRGSMGSAFRVPIWSKVEIDVAIDWAKKNEFRTICVDINAESELGNTDWHGKKLIGFGSEAVGFSDTEKNLFQEGVRIPMRNDVESLNLAVSCGIILFDAVRD